MRLNKFLNQVRTFQHDTATRRLRGEFAKITQEFRSVKNVPQRFFIFNRFGSKLDNRTGFHITPGTDVMTDSRCRGTKCLPLMIIVGVNHTNRLFSAHVNHKLAYATLLFRCESERGFAM